MRGGDASRRCVNDWAATDLVANSHRSRSADESPRAPPAGTLARERRQKAGLSGFWRCGFAVKTRARMNALEQSGSEVKPPLCCAGSGSSTVIPIQAAFDAFAKQERMNMTDR